MAKRPWAREEHARRAAAETLLERQREAKSLLTDALGDLARRDARFRELYGAVVTSGDALTLLETAGEAVFFLANVRYNTSSQNSK